MVTAGLSGAFVHDVPTCKEVIDTIIADAEAIIKQRVGSMFA